MAETMSEEEWLALLKKNGDEWRRMLDFEKRLEMEAIDEVLVKQKMRSNGSPDMTGAEKE